MNERQSVPVAVDDDETLHRIVNSGEVRGNKPHYMAFYSATEPCRISVDRAAYRTKEQSLESASPAARLAALLAGHVRQLEVQPALAIESKPENGNEAHAEIVVTGTYSKKFIKTKLCALLADISRIV